MKKLFLFIAAALVSTGMWAATETITKFEDSQAFTSVSFTHDEGGNGSAAVKKDGDAVNVTYIKFRTNKNGNTITLNVNDGYKVTGLSVRGYSNDNSKEVKLASVKYDSNDAITVNQSFPNKTAGTTYTYSNATDEATSAIVLSFSDNAGTQLMAVMTITYEAPTFYTIEYDLNGGTGTEPTETSKIEGATFTLHDGVTGITAPTNYAFIGWNDGTKTYAGGATYTVGTSNVTLTAQWEEIACPSGASISGENEYAEYDDIELTANLTAGNGAITYTWYKGADLASAKAADPIGTGKTYSKTSCTKSDAGNYFCVATKADCSEAASSAFEVTITDYVCPSSGLMFSLEFVNTSSVTMSDGDNLSLTSSYATIVGGGSTASIKYFRSGNTNKEVLNTSNSIIYGTNDMYLKLELACALQAGDSIKFANGTGDQLAIATEDKTPQSATNKVATTSYQYIVVKNDVLDGQNVIYIGRNTTTTSYHKKITIIRPAGSPTSIDNTNDETKAVKRIVNGQLVIEKNGKTYNAQGIEIR